MLILTNVLCDGLVLFTKNHCTTVLNHRDSIFRLLSVCRVYSVNTAYTLVLSVFYGVQSDCCTAFFYNA